MSDSTPNPLAPQSAEQEQRQRERAYFLWLDDGCPEGQEDEYWERAGELLAMQNSAGAGEIPVDDPRARPDEAQLQDNLGEFPGRFTDQGDERMTPMTRQAERTWASEADQPAP